MKKKTSRKKSEFLSYFDLWDAFKKPGCPICTLVERFSFRFLDALLYERVNDPGTRVRLRESLGFCNWHAWKASEVSNCALGLGIIYEDILNRIAERLKRVQDSFPILSRVPFLLKLFRQKRAVVAHSPLGPIGRCPACQHVRFFEKLYLEALLDYIPEADFERQFNHSAGICFAHLVETVEKFPQHKNLPLLIKKQTEKFESLRKEVAEFVRKQDFQYADEPRGSEVDSWKRALEMVVGKREIFSIQVDRVRLEDEQPLNHFPMISGEKEPPEEAAKGNFQDVIEKLKFENEKWRRKYEGLREEYTKESSRASSLHYIAWKTAEDNKTLKLNLAGANAEARLCAEHVERLNKEVERLRDLLKKQS